VAEQTIVSAAAPSLVTTASGAVTLGTTAPTLSDSAALAGGYFETGTITFTLSGPGGFSFRQADTVVGNGTYAASDTLPTTGTIAGTYTWSAAYSGDANNNSAHDQGGTAEQMIVSAAAPSLVTTASGAVTLGTTAPTLSDSAVLFGGSFETGTITFTLTGPGGFTFTHTDTVSGNGTYTASDMVPTAGTVAGTYTWSAAYSGDANNNSAHDQGGTGEQTVVSAATPMLATVPNPTSVILGTTALVLKDTAALSGGYFETGTITFTLFHGTTLVDTEMAAVNGNGTYSTPTGYTLQTTGTVTGTYQWDASYSGDANNHGVTDNNSPNEQVTVSAAPHLALTAPASATAGSTFSLTISVLDGSGAVVTGYRGTVHFISSDPRAHLPGDYTFTAKDKGLHTFKGLTLFAAGSQFIRATDTNQATITGQATVMVNPGAATRFGLSAPANSVSGAAFGLTVTALDAWGNVATGYRGTVQFTSSDRQATLPPNYPFVSADNGVHLFTGVILRTLGSQQINAADTKNHKLTGNVTVMVTAAVALIGAQQQAATPVAPNSSLGVDASSGAISATAAQSLSVTLQASDAPGVTTLDASRAGWNAGMQVQDLGLLVTDEELSAPALLVDPSQPWTQQALDAFFAWAPKRA
jgi:hypothetical protein